MSESGKAISTLLTCLFVLVSGICIVQYLPHDGGDDVVSFAMASMGAAAYIVLGGAGIIVCLVFSFSKEGWK